MKLVRQALSLASLTLLAFASPAMAGDNLADSGRVIKGGKGVWLPAAPVLIYYSRKDNQDNAGSGLPDADVGTYVCEGDPNFPIEFELLVKEDPATYTAQLRLKAFDVDSADGETSEVKVNGTTVGVLTGEDGLYVENTFDIPAGVLFKGRNLVTVGQLVPGWCNAVSWGAIGLTR